ncbi:MAG: hypothetical protein RSB25_19780, partial [Acinetobacter sp.]
LSKKRNYKAPDFVRMILDLRNLHWSHQRIAFLIGVGPSAVSAWATGRRPFFENGDYLIMLWRDQTGLDREPRIGEQLTYQYSIKTKKTATTLKEREFKTMIFDSILEDVKLQLENEMSYEDILRLHSEYGAGNVTDETTKANNLYADLIKKGQERRKNVTKRDSSGEG